MASPLPERIEAYLEDNVISGQLVIGNDNLVINAPAGAVITLPGRPVTPRLRPLPVLLRRRPFPGLLDRQREIGAAVAALDEGLPLDLHGPPGQGKTSLLRCLAHRERHASLPDGIVHLSARGLAREDLEQALFEAFWETEAPFRPKAAGLQHALQERRALVLLDDVEVAREEIEALLDLAPGCAFVLASSERRLWGEARAVALAGLPADAALELLERELGRPLEPAERSAAERLVTALEGHPLHVLQAAARVREGKLPLAEMERLVASSTADARLLTEADSRSEPQKRLLAVLAAVGGGPLRASTLEALAEVPGALPRLEELAALWLVEPQGQGFRLNGELARALEKAWDLSSWREKAAARFGAAPEGPPPEVPPDEAEAVRGLRQRMLESGRFAEAVRLARSVEALLFRSARWGSWALVLEAALSAAEAQQDRAAEAWCLHQLGSRALVLGKTDFARRALSQALRIRESLGAELEAAITRHNLSLLGMPAEQEDKEDEETPEPASRARLKWLLAALVPLFLGLGLWLWPRPGALRFEPAELEFADQLVTVRAAPRTVTLRNEGGGPLAIAAVRLGGGDHRDFALAADHCSGKTLEARESCVVEVAFAPRIEELRRAEAVVESADGAKLQSLRLQGRGVRSRASLSPDRLAFDGRQVGTRSDALALTLTSAGSAPFVLGDWQLRGDAGDFTVRGESCVRTPLPPQKQCALEVAFTPQREGLRRAEVVFASAAGERLPPVELAGTGTAPHLLLRPTLLAFEPRLGATAEGEVTVANGGTAPLPVRAVKLAGSGTGFAVARDRCSGRTLAAREECKVSVRFQAASEESREDGLTIAADAAGGPWFVRLSGLGTAGHLEIVPESLDFGAPRVGRGQTRELSLRNSGSAPVAVGSLTFAGSQAFSFARDGCAGNDLAPGASCAVEIELLPRREGQEDGELRIENDSLEGERRVPLAGRAVAPHLRIEPASLEFGRQRAGARAEARTLSLTSTGGAPVEIARVEIGDPQNAFSLVDDRCSGRRLAQGEPCTIGVGFAPGRDTPYRGEIRIAHDATGDPDSVPLTGEGAAPRARVEPLEIDFGEGELGARRRPRTVRVESVGTWPLEVREVSLAPPEGPFGLRHDCAGRKLANGESCEIRLSFLPRGAEAFRGRLAIAHSAGDDPYRVELRGSASPPARPEIRWMPQELNFDVLVAQKDNDEALRKLSVESTGTAPLMIEKVRIEPEYRFTLSGDCEGRELAPGESCTVELRFLPADPGERRAELRLETNAAGNPHVVKVLVRVRPREDTVEGDLEPQARWEPEALEFGRHEAGSQRMTKEVLVFSVGTAPLIVKAITVEGDTAGYSIAGENCLGRGPIESCSIHVGFAPGRPGEKSGELRFETNEPDSPHRVRLHAWVGKGPD